MAFPGDKASRKCSRCDTILSNITTRANDIGGEKYLTIP